MGLTKSSVGKNILMENFQIKKESGKDIIIALAGNPNVGKSTVFNNLTGLNQHTGNWPGKTVTSAEGNFRHRNRENIMIDLPGTYSLMANSKEEEVARDFICFGNPDVTLVVVDATSVERNLNLVMQTMEITDKVVVCVNLIDEAKRKGITVNTDKLSEMLGVRVVSTNARSKFGFENLKNAILKTVDDREIKPFKVEYNEEIEHAIKDLSSFLFKELKNEKLARWMSLRLLDQSLDLNGDINKYISTIDKEQLDEKMMKAKEILYSYKIDTESFRDNIVETLIRKSEEIYSKSVMIKLSDYNKMDRKIDRIITSKIYGIPIMIFLLMVVLWLTISGSNYPSALLSKGLFYIEDQLLTLFEKMNANSFITNLLVLGMYRTLAWVVSVMLPPMAIFFPLFTLLEDLGYLPRVAFNLDSFFKKSCACGKQSLTMCMGFGCNAAGVIGCRIIDSPRERIIAIITNNFVPCNGRFPTLIAIISMFFAGMLIEPLNSAVLAALLTAVILLGIFLTFQVSKFLSHTFLKGTPSSFTLELPPYRKPQIWKIITRSIMDRTIFVLGRAISVAIPAGIVIWILANVTIGDLSILKHLTLFLDPFAKLIGLDGVILVAFILGFPANEIVFPIIIMAYMSTGHMIEFDSLNELKALLVNNGWTYVTAVCTMLFSLIHFPCATTILTIKKETGSLKWTALSFAIPTIIGIVVCFFTANILRLFVL